MGTELLDNEVTTQKTHTEIFYEHFPFYLSIGMPPAEYWEGDPTLTRYYRKAFQLKQEHEDYNAWLHGLYVYDAVSVSIYNSFCRKEKDTPKNYFEHPITIAKKMEAELAEKKRIEAEAKAEAWMNNLVQSHKINKR